MDQIDNIAENYNKIHLFYIYTFFKYTAPTCPHCTRWACEVCVLSRKEQDLSPDTKLALLQRFSLAQRRAQGTEESTAFTESGFRSNKRQFSLIVNRVCRCSWVAFVIDIVFSTRRTIPVQSFCWEEKISHGNFLVSLPNLSFPLPPTFYQIDLEFKYSIWKVLYTIPEYITYLTFREEMENSWYCTP